MPYLQHQSLIELFHQNPSRYSPLTQFFQNVMRGESSFTAGERELIAAYVSSLNSCNFCSLFSFMNRLVDGFGFESPAQEQLAGMAKMINTQGYRAIVQSAK